MTAPIVYCLSAAADERFLAALQKMTMPLQRQGTLTLQDRTTVEPGAVHVEDAQVASARVVLALLTAELLADEDCLRLLRGARARGQRVMPVLVRRCLWQEEEVLGLLVPLPRDGKWIEDADNAKAWESLCVDLKRLLADLPQVAAPARSLPPSPRCFGREVELQALREALLRPEPVIVLGDAGMGKTTLLVKALHDTEVAVAYGARYFVRCDGASGRDALLLETARVVGVTPWPGMEQELLRRLAQQPTLLALDNAETPWWAEEGPVEALLEALAGAAQLVMTLRGALRPGRVAFQEAITLRPLGKEAARAVFLAAAGQRHAQDPQLDELIHAVDQLPLALTLLGHLAEADPDLSTVCAQWQAEGPAVLQRGEGRLDNLGRSLDLSIHGPRMKRCPEALRLLALLGVLPDGIRWDALEVLLPGAHYSAARTLRGVGLAYDEGAVLRVLAPVREHVRRSCPLTPEDEERALTHYLKRAEEFGKRFGEQGGAESMGLLVAETANLEAAARRGLDSGRHALTLPALVGLGELARFSGHQGQSVALLAVAAQASPDPKGRARCLALLGDIALGRSNHALARDHFDDALLLYKEVGDIREQASCIFRLGEFALRSSVHREARARFDDALLLYKEVRDIQGQANCIRSLGHIALQHSKYEEAATHFDAALSLCKRGGNIHGEASCLFSLGVLAFARSDYGKAQEHFDTALPLFKNGGDIQGRASCLFSLGDLAFARSDYGKAQEHFGDALPLFRQWDDIQGQANSIMRLGEVALARSEPADARARFDAALSLYSQIPEPFSIGWTQIRLARLCADLKERATHAAAAFAAWRSIDRGDLIAPCASEFPLLPAEME